MVLPVAAVGAAGASAGKAATLQAVATYAQLAGVGLAAIGAVSSGAAANRQMEFQASVLHQQAERERQDASQREEDSRRQQSRLMATRRAMLGGTGVEAGEGSPLLVSEDLAGESELQALRIRAGGEVASNRLEQSAILARAQGKSARQAGFMRGGALLLRGAGSTFASKGIPLN